MSQNTASAASSIAPLQSVSSIAKTAPAVNVADMNKVMQEMLSKSLAAGLANAKVETPAEEKINPSVHMLEMANEMEKLYQRFDALKRLAVEINGMNMDAAFPTHVNFKSITLDFDVTKNGKTEEYSAKIQNVSTIGDVATLMSNEFGFIIASLTELSGRLSEISQRTNEKCSSAFAEWQEKHQRQIVPVAPESGATTGMPTLQPQNADAETPAAVAPLAAQTP